MDKLGGVPVQPTKAEPSRDLSKKHPVISSLCTNHGDEGVDNLRVHMAHVGYPLVGDQTYGVRFRIPPAASVAMVEAVKNFPRQALHARFLALDHPTTGERMEWLRRCRTTSPGCCRC